eukprot:6213807-Pleurochrysis_carterae.AAC.5
MRARRGAYARGTKRGVTVRTGSAVRATGPPRTAGSMGSSKRVVAMESVCWLRAALSRRGSSQPLLANRSSCIQRFMKPVGWSGTDQGSGKHANWGEGALGRAFCLFTSAARFDVRARTGRHVRGGCSAMPFA